MHPTKKEGGTLPKKSLQFQFGDPILEDRFREHRPSSGAQFKFLIGRQKGLVDIMKTQGDKRELLEPTL